MGQRLVIVVYQPKGTKEGLVKYLATAYYHWDAYTLQALEDTKACYTWWKENHKEDGNLLHEAIHMLEASGAGITKEAKIALGKDSTLFTEAVDRNSGLIDITLEGIDTSLEWSEGEVYINIETGQVIFEVFNYLYKEDLEEEDFSRQEIEQALPTHFSKESSEDVTNFSGENIQKVIDYLEKNESCLFKDSKEKQLKETYLSCVY